MQGIAKRLSRLVHAVMATIALLALPGSAYPAEVTLTWVPHNYLDGSAASDLAGYNVYFGKTSRQYQKPVYVGNVTSYTLVDLSGGDYYFAVTAVNKDGAESAYSNEVYRYFTPPPELHSLTPANGIDGALVTVSGANFGDKNGIVYVGRRMARIADWSAAGDSVSFISPSRMPHGGYDIRVMDNNKQRSINTKAYNVMKARISGLSASSAAPGDAVVLTGEFLGPVPKVYLIYEHNGITKRIPAKVKNYSVADNLNSTVQFMVPRLPPNTYLLVVKNSQGVSDGWNFEVK